MLTCLNKFSLNLQLLQWPMENDGRYVPICSNHHLQTGQCPGITSALESIGRRVQTAGTEAHRGDSVATWRVAIWVCMKIGYTQIFMVYQFIIVYLTQTAILWVFRHTQLFSFFYAVSFYQDDTSQWFITVKQTPCCHELCGMFFSVRVAGLSALHARSHALRAWWTSRAMAQRFEGGAEPPMSVLSFCSSQFCWSLIWQLSFPFHNLLTRRCWG